jgi:hypothetical protein
MPSPDCGVDPVWWTVCHLGRLSFLEHLRLGKPIFLGKYRTRSV